MAECNFRIYKKLIVCKNLVFLSRWHEIFGRCFSVEENFGEKILGSLVGVVFTRAFYRVSVACILHVLIVTAIDKSKVMCSNTTVGHKFYRSLTASFFNSKILGFFDKELEFFEDLGFFSRKLYGLPPI